MKTERVREMMLVMSTLLRRAHSDLLLKKQTVSRHENEPANCVHYVCRINASNRGADRTSASVNILGQLCIVQTWCAVHQIVVVSMDLLLQNYIQEPSHAQT